MSTEIIAALGVAAFCVAAGIGLWLLKNLVDAAENVASEVRGMEATHNSIREGLEQGLGQLVDAVRAHTSAVRDTAESAPAAVLAQRDQLAVDNEKLTGAIATALDFAPDPNAGPYAAAGADEAMGHVRETLKAAL